jgi:hypothetical protein
MHFVSVRRVVVDRRKDDAHNRRQSEGEQRRPDRFYVEPE